MSAPSLLSFDRDDWHERPWARVLETFGVPFLCYDAGARCAHASGVARKMLSCVATGAVIRGEAERVVAEVSQRSFPAPIADFALIREVPLETDGLALAVYNVRSHGGGRCTVVVIRPAADTTARGEQVEGLTPRETGVARLLAAGLSAKAIASQLGISPHTARHHTERVYTKLGVRRRGAVAALVATRIKAGA